MPIIIVINKISTPRKKSIIKSTDTPVVVLKPFSKEWQKQFD